MSPSWFLVSLTFRTGTGFTSLDNHKCLSRAQFLSTKQPVALLSSSASTSIVLTGPWTQTGIRTSHSIVTVHLNSTRKPTSRSSVGLSESLDAKEGNSCPLISTRELSTPLFTSGAKPLLGTPIDSTVEVRETKEVVVSAQSVVHWVSTSSTTKDAYLLGKAETGEDTVATFLWVFSILRCSKEIQ